VGRNFADAIVLTLLTTTNNRILGCRFRQTVGM